MNRCLTVALILLAGAGLRLALYSANRSLFSHPQVDEIVYLEPPAPPFERPPGTYLPAGLPGPRIVFAAISLLPSLFFLVMLPRSGRNTVLGALAAVEPTLALSGIQILPEAPAAALTALCLVLCANGKLRLGGFALGLTALFRGEMLLLLPLSPLAGKRGVRMALFALPAVLPVIAVNLFSGGPASVASTGGINLWIGSEWHLLTTPPGVEFEQLMEISPGQSFTDRALAVVSRDPAGWAFRGIVKTLGFFSLPGPGRNIDSGAALGVVMPLLAVTAFFLAGTVRLRRDVPSLFMITALVSAFLFFPSVRYRAVFLPAFAMAAIGCPWKRLLPGAVAVLALSLLLVYPGNVRPGLNSVLMAENALRDNNPEQCLALLEDARRSGFEGADLHNIRASAMAVRGMEFGEVLVEFGQAIEGAPRSPTVWRNTAVFLWNYGRSQPAREAAEKALSLNPALMAELAPILME